MNNNISLILIILLLIVACFILFKNLIKNCCFISEKFGYAKSAESDNELENEAKLFQQASLPSAGELSEAGGPMMEEAGLLSPKTSFKENPFLYNPDVSWT